MGHQVTDRDSLRHSVAKFPHDRLILAHGVPLHRLWSGGAIRHRLHIQNWNHLKLSVSSHSHDLVLLQTFFTQALPHDFHFYLCFRHATAA